jgi:transposase InsO family protein
MACRVAIEAATGIATPSCGLHRIERLMRLQALKARPRRRRLPPDLGERQASAVAPNVLDRSFEAPAPNRKWIADFTYVWTAEGWLYVSAVVDLFSRRVVGWSMNTAMTAQLVTDALVMETGDGASLCAAASFRSRQPTPIQPVIATS